MGRGFPFPRYLPQQGEFMVEFRVGFMTLFPDLAMSITGSVSKISLKPLSHKSSPNSVHWKMARFCNLQKGSVVGNVLSCNPFR